MKDVSFWCVVLSIVVILIIHHILSNTFEGLDNGEETPDSEMSEMTFEAEFAEQDDPVSCIGSWSSCNANCEKRYTITTQKVGTGDACEYENGMLNLVVQVKVCPKQIVDGVVVENQGIAPLDDTLYHLIC